MLNLKDKNTTFLRNIGKPLTQRHSFTFQDT